MNPPVAKERPLIETQEEWFARVRGKYAGINPSKPIRKRNETARGYAAPPGSGPQGETCRSCIHACSRTFAKKYWKCDLVKATASTKTDIRLKSPACSRWEKKEGAQP